MEDWKDRIYQTEEFKAVGAEIVPAGSWKDAPKEDIILGLKEIDSDGSMFPLFFFGSVKCELSDFVWC